MTCFVCGQALEVDDVAIDTKWPICLRCFTRETEKPTKPVPVWLERMVRDAAGRE